MSQPSRNQLKKYKSKIRREKNQDVLTTGFGVPIGDKLNSMTVDRRGPIVMQDNAFIDEMAHFDREVIPERIVHAKGAGAHGYFEVTDDITQYTKASVFSEIGKRTPVFVRFSNTGGRAGSADTLRDGRGFAIKYYTEQGIWDSVGNNTPIFFLRDPSLFPSLVHAGRPNPATGVGDANAQWDMLSLIPEVTHQVMIGFTERALPRSLVNIHGFPAHAFKLINAQGEAVYCKFHYITNQGIENMSQEEAFFLAGTNPDYYTQDLYDAIERGDHPSWTLNIQIMTFSQAETWKFNPFDPTKVWPQAEFPFIKVGTLTLDRNPSNYFAEVEQAAFSPANMPPGIEPSPDRVLHGRMFSYGDTQRYRLGANHLQIPINRSQSAVSNYQRDGAMTVTDNQGGAPNYYPNTFGGPEQDPQFIESTYRVTIPEVARFNTDDQDNYTQPQNLWNNVLSPDAQDYMARNIALALSFAEPSIQDRAIGNLFEPVSPDFAQMIREYLATFKKQKPDPRTYVPHRFY